MQSRIAELKLDETRAVVGGRYIVTMAAVSLKPSAASLQFGSAGLNVKPIATFAGIR